MSSTSKVNNLPNTLFPLHEDYMWGFLRLGEPEKLVFFQNIAFHTYVRNLSKGARSHPAVFFSLIFSLGEHSRPRAHCFITIRELIGCGTCKVICFTKNVFEKQTWCDQSIAWQHLKPRFAKIVRSIQRHTPRRRYSWFVSGCCLNLCWQRLEELVMRANALPALITCGMEILYRSSFQLCFSSPNSQQRVKTHVRIYWWTFLLPLVLIMKRLPFVLVLCNTQLL